MQTRNLADVELGRLTRLVLWMTALWAATVLEHRPWLESQFWQGRHALAHRQLRSEPVDKIEQGQQGSSRAEAVLCRFTAPIGQEAVEEDHLGHPGGMLCMGMAAGSDRHKIKGGGGVLPIVIWI
jgi:hypothetical protein